MKCIHRVKCRCFCKSRTCSSTKKEGLVFWFGLFEGQWAARSQLCCEGVFAFSRVSFDCNDLLWRGMWTTKRVYLFRHYYNSQFMSISLYANASCRSEVGLFPRWILCFYILRVAMHRHNNSGFDSREGGILSFPSTLKWMVLPTRIGLAPYLMFLFDCTWSHFVCHQYFEIEAVEGDGGNDKSMHNCSNTLWGSNSTTWKMI